MTSAPIFLVGYMACGKTTFGRALARRLGWTFIDLDFYIEQRFRMSISDIFAARGQDAFRRIEAAMLREVGEMQSVIVACGGGTPCFGDNMDYMNAQGTTVWLEASEERLALRLSRNRARRPLVAQKSDAEILDFIRAHLPGRIPFYSRAHLRFGADLLEDARQIQASVDSFIDRNPQFLAPDE